jgi:hypothetical protein
VRFIGARGGTSDSSAAGQRRYGPIRAAVLIAACFGGVLLGLALFSMFPRAAGAATVPPASTQLPTASGGVGRTLSGLGALGDPSAATGTPTASAPGPATGGVPRSVATAVSDAIAPAVGTLPSVVTMVASRPESMGSGVLTSVGSSVDPIPQSPSTPTLHAISESAGGLRTSPSVRQAGPSDPWSSAARRAVAAHGSRWPHGSGWPSNPGPRRPAPASPPGPLPLVPGLPPTAGNDVGLVLTQGSGAQAGHPSTAPLLPAPGAWVRSRGLLGGPGILTVPSLSPPG